MYSVDLISVNKVYQTSETNYFQALRDVNFKVKKGEFVAILGPSGSGKSTLMNILGLLDQPTSGSYLLDGLQVSKLRENRLSEIRNKKIGFIFQNFNLLQRTTALQNVVLPLIYAGLSRVERDVIASKSLENVSMADKVSSYPNQLSGGEQQRVAIARALVTNPEIILADEPTGNLDTKTGSDIVKIFLDLNKKGKTIILITHDPGVSKVAKRIIHLKDGRIV